MDTGQAVATPRITLVQEIGEQAGILVFHPVYRNGSAVATVQDRRENLAGFAVGVFRVGDLLEEAFAGTDLKEFRIGTEVQIYDRSAGAADNLLYLREFDATSAQDQAPTFQVARMMSIGQRQWEIVVATSTSPWVWWFIWQPWAAFAGGLGLTSVLSLYLLGGLRRTERVERMITERTLELRESNNELETEISERKLFEDALRESGEQQRVLLNAIPDAMLRVTKDGELAEFKPSRDWQPFDNPEVLVGQRFSETLPAQVIKIFWSNVELSRQSGETQICEWNMEVAGVVQDLEVRIAVTADDIIAIVRDITERKRWEEDIKSASAWTNAILETATDGIVTFDEKGCIESFNPGASRIFGYSPEEIIGRNFSVLMTESDHSQHDQHLKSYMQGGNLQINDSGLEVMGLRKDGSTFNMDLAVSEFQWEGRRTFVGMLHETTRQREAEEGLRRSEARQRALLNAIPDAMFHISNDGTCVDFKPAKEWEGMVAPEEFIGKTVFDTLPPKVAQMCMDHAEIARELNESQIFEYRLPVNDELVDYEARIVISNEDEFLAMVRDVTERKRAEVELKKLNATLEHSNRELADFAYVASHDLQEPLRKIEAFGERLRDKYYDTLGEQGGDYLDRMSNAAGRMRILIQDLLTYSRVTTRAQPFETVDLDEVARGVLSDLEVAIEQAGARVEVGDLPTLAADSTQMGQLLQNLIGNALKFRRPEVPPVVKVQARLLEPGDGEDSVGDSSEDWCEITVSDNGIGFDEKYADRIFQVFQRLHGRSEYEGTGVGLAVCRKIVERHNGTITPKSAPGEGASFIILIPVKQSKSQVKALAA